LIGPSGAITDTTPDFQWNAINGIDLYYLYATGPSGGAVSAWYSPTQAGCSLGIGSTCSITPTSALTGGSYTWQILPYNSAGVGPWSAPLSFSLPVPLPPDQVTLIAPSGTISTSTPTYSWNAVSDVELYYLYVNGPMGNEISSWYSPTQAGCSSGTGTCSIDTGKFLTGGPHTWQVLSYNSVGTGPWSAEMSFTPPGIWSEFNGDATGWWIPNDDSTLWYLDSNFVYTDGPTDGSFFTSLYNEGTYDNLVYSADFYRSGNSGWANTLLIRGNPATLDADGAWTNGYLFHYSDGGFYTVWKMVNGVQTALQSWTYTSAIVTGPAWNTLTAWAQGDQLWFSINGT